MNERRRFRPRSLWVRALTIALLVAVCPQLFVGLSSLSDSRVGQQMVLETRDAATRTARVLEQGLTAEQTALKVDGLARRHVVRIRVLDEQGAVLLDRDHEEGISLLFRLGGMFFGPDGAPSLLAFDLAQPPVPQRPETLAAWERGRASGCDGSEGSKLLVCHHALRVNTADGQRLVYVQESSRRAIRALYDLRYQVLKLTLFSVLMALVLGGWLGWRIVRPVRLLREEVRDRARAPVSTEPVKFARDDEIGDLAQSFNELLVALEQRNQAYESFAADLAHELKNPVAAVRAAAEALQRQETADPVRVARVARVLDRSGRRLDELVTRFLELARAEAGLVHQERLELDLAALVRGLAEQREGGAAVRVDAPAQAWMSGAPSQLEAALRNLLDNALSFAGPDGQVHITLTSHPGGGWQVQVLDSGPGIPPDLLERVFDRFFTTRGQSNGTGLGLAMARAVFQAHGGTLAAATPSGGAGALFVGHLPVAQGAEPSLSGGRGG